MNEVEHVHTVQRVDTRNVEWIFNEWVEVCRDPECGAVLDWGPSTIWIAGDGNA